MKLPDFTEFEPFKQLRLSMGARKAGHFELFNPDKHLTGRERSELDQQGKQFPLHRLKRFADNTWGLKNTRLAVYLAQENTYHLAQCEITHLWLTNQTVWATTRRVGDLPFGEQTTSRKICPECLQLLNYKGFDLHKNRKIAYSKNLINTFSREEFFRIYTLYPVQGLAEKLA